MKKELLKEIIVCLFILGVAVIIGCHAIERFVEINTQFTWKSLEFLSIEAIAFVTCGIIAGKLVTDIEDSIYTIRNTKEEDAEEEN